MPGPRQALSSTKLIRSANTVSVLRTLHTEGGCSRTKLTRLTRMSPATITRIVSGLSEQGLISESGVASSNGGRKPVILALNYDRIFIAGLLVLRDRVDLIVADMRGAIVARRGFYPYSLEPSAFVKETAVEFESLLAGSGVNKEHLIGVGVAVSGITDSVTGMLLRSTNLGWREVAIAQALEEAFGFPVVVENDANAAALAELWFGCAKEAPTLLYIKTDRGVGAGIIYERSLLTGARGMAGEIGHVPLIRSGWPCRCGQNGCLETYLYIPDVLRRYEEATGRRLPNGETFFARAREGDPAARAIVDEAADAIGTAASLAAGLLDLDMVVIGGLWGRQGEEFGQRIRQVYQAVLNGCGLNKDLTVLGSSLGEDADLLGAVGLVINHWFTPPIQATSDGGTLFAERISENGRGLPSAASLSSE